MFMLIDGVFHWPHISSVTFNPMEDMCNFDISKAHVQVACSTALYITDFR